MSNDSYEVEVTIISADRFMHNYEHFSLGKAVDWDDAQQLYNEWYVGTAESDNPITIVVSWNGHTLSFDV